MGINIVEISPILLMVTAIAAFLSTVASFMSVWLNRRLIITESKTNRSQIYIEMSERYSSDEIHAAIQALRNWRIAHGESFVQAWSDGFGIGDAEAVALDLHRRRLATFFYDVLRLHELGILDHDLARALTDGYGAKVYVQICLPLGEPLFKEMANIMKRLKKIDKRFGQGELSLPTNF